ncbi:MAG: hypothetical protein IJA52_06195 [Clostridia bacterium]|nr:hypothetical protein [Clostridia bacterium]
MMRINKFLSILVCVLFVLVAFWPLGVIIAHFFGYSFSLFSYSFFSIVTAVVSAAAAVISFFADREHIKKVYSVLASIVPIILIANYCSSFVKCSSDDHFTIGIAMMIALLFAVILSLQVGKPVALNAVILATSLAVVIPIIIVSYIMSAFSGLGATNTVVETIPSPDGERWVEVIDNDQGALGGATVIRVCEDKGIDLFVFQAEKLPIKIYEGEWRAYEELDIRWKDNDCVLINSREYKID